jgi:hypothetical protein
MIDSSLLDRGLCRGVPLYICPLSNNTFFELFGKFIAQHVPVNVKPSLGLRRCLLDDPELLEELFVSRPPLS